MNRSVLASIGLLALAAAAAANASTINLSQDLGSVGFGPHAYGFDNGPKSDGPLFTDVVNFTMNVTGDVQNFIDEAENIASGLKVSLFDTTQSKSILDCNGGCGTFQDFGNLTNGDSYALTFSGTITGNPSSVGDLDGHLKIFAPVPEPASLALMFAGVGLLLTYSLRRRSL